MSTRARMKAERMRMATAVVKGALDARPATWISHGELVKTMAAIVADELPEIREAIFEAMEQMARTRTDVIVEEDVRSVLGPEDKPRYAIAILIQRARRPQKGRH